MRCPYCGSKMIYPDVNHKHFSTGKAVAGAVAFGMVGAAAGFIGKDTKGYRCSACGAFCAQTMDISTELGINSAVRSAEGGDFSVYNELRKQYPNIETVFQNSAGNVSKNGFDSNVYDNYAAIPDIIISEETSIKNSYSPRVFIKDCPIYIETIYIKATKNNDVMSLLAWNISEKTLRSVYFKIKILDDVGDEISTCSCVYQGLAISSGEKLPLDKEFNLNTDLAYKIQFEIEKAAFDDDSVWRANENTIKFELSEQAEILPGNFPKYKYLREIVEKKSSLSESDKIFQPVFEEEYTQCICGFPMSKNCSCVRCGLTEKLLKNAVSYEKLLECQNKSIKDLASKRSKAAEKLLNSARQEKYKKAIELQNGDSKEDINESIKIFKSLGNYEDSQEQIKISKNKVKILEEKIVAKRIAEEKAAEEKRIAEEKEAESRRIEQEKIAEEQRIAAEKAAKKRKKITFITSVASIFVVIFVVVLFTVIVPNIKYNNAINHINKGEYINAYETLLSLDDYKDSKTKMSEIYFDYKKEKLKQANVGDNVIWGSYEQDTSSSNGTEDIEWLVLDKTSDKLLLISEYALDCIPYNNEDMNVTWETSTLRKWLNEEFLNTAFSNDELDLIAKTTVKTAISKSIYEDKKTIFETQDQIFVLSGQEANKYFLDKGVLTNKSVPTETAIKNGVDYHEYPDGDGAYCYCWWLRNHGWSGGDNNTDLSKAAYFMSFSEEKYGEDGVYYLGDPVNYDTIGVRPAVWINIK